MTKYKIYISILCLALFTSCREEVINDGLNWFAGEPTLDFSWRIADSISANQTRAMTQPSVNVEPSEFPCYFYIDINAPECHDPDDPSAPTENKSKFGEYIVPKSGNGGMLEYAGENINLKPNWFTIDDTHYFWSWTLPWTEIKGLADPTVTTNPGDPSDPTKPTDPTDPTDPSDPTEPSEPSEPDSPTVTFDPSKYLNTNPITVRLRNTTYDEFRYQAKTDSTELDSVWKPGSWGNGYFFEQFIGAKSGPYDFRKNGPVVPLDFRHLMSKISVRSLLFYRADGSREEDYKANITFINMPTEFTFYPHPTEDGTPGQDNQYMKRGGPPIVVTNQASADPNGGITFGFTNPIDLLPEEVPDNKVEYRDKFYICPEVDFSKVSFMVVVSDSNRMTRGEYYGDFSSVAFEREDNKDYDRPTDALGNPIDDTTVLHAGEVMYFDLIVREYGGGGYSIYVRNWSTRPQQKTKHYPHPGIYTDGEAVELAGTGSTWGAKYESYGDGYWENQDGPATPDNPGIVNLYSDVSLGNRTTYPIDNNYLIYGNGYRMTFNTTNLDTTTITIGKMVDVYLEMNGFTVYIDTEGNVCIFNASTNRYMPTGYSIDITGEKSSFTINLATGEVT